MFKSNEKNKSNATQERLHITSRSVKGCVAKDTERSGQLWESHKSVWLSVVAETLDEYLDVTLPFLIMHYNGLYLRLNL